MSGDSERRERRAAMFGKICDVVPLPPRDGRSDYVTNTIERAEAVAVFLVHYVGHPRGSTLLGVVRRVLADHQQT